MKYNTSIQDKNDFYPVHYACFQKEYYWPRMPHIENSEQGVSSQGSQGSSQYLDIIQFLENQNKGILNSIHMYCKTIPLHILCMYGNLEGVTKILQSLNFMQSLVRDQNGSNIVHFACVGGNLAVVKHIAQHCRAIRYMHCSNHSGNTALHLACMYGHKDVVKYLVKEHEYDVKCENEKGFSALHCACLCLKPPLRNGDNLDVVKYLVEEKNIDPNLRNSGGITPLHLASLYGGLQIVRYLTEVKHCGFNTGNG